MKKHMRGSWLNDNLLVLIKALNGDKLIMVYGKAGHRLKQTMKNYGFEYNRTAQRWERTVRKTSKIPNFLKENKE
jgi:aspartate aminotransferase-like enzyme